MNGALLTSLLILFFLFASCERAVYAQPNGYTQVEHRGLVAITPNGCWPDTGLYDEAKLNALRLKPNCKTPIESNNVDLRHRSLAYYMVRSDCNMRIATKLFRVDFEKKYKLLINVIYGGCRASGSRSGWIEFEALPPGYVFEVVEIGVERIPGDAPRPFVFPKPPPIVTHEKLPIREVSLDCFELTGQSQWVIQNSRILLDALKYKPNEKECSEAVKALSVDLEKETLVGYSFASGHCGRPPKLAYSLIKETSSDPRENRVVIKATYESAGTAHCKTWTTYPVWLVIPKQRTTYRFDLSAEAI